MQARLKSSASNKADLIDDAEKLKQIKYYKAHSQQSILWQYLDVVAGGYAKKRPFKVLIQALLGFVPDNMKAILHLNGLMLNVRHDIPWLSCNNTKNNPFGMKIDQLYESECLQRDARGILFWLNKNKNRKQNISTIDYSSFVELMTLKSESLDRQFLLWQTYYQLDKIITHSIFSLGLIHAASLNEKKEILSNPLWLRFLSKNALDIIGEHISELKRKIIQQVYNKLASTSNKLEPGNKAPQSHSIKHAIFEILPTEMSLAVFANLNHEQLHVVAQISLHGYQLAKNTYRYKEIKFYKENARSGILWKFLHVIGGAQLSNLRFSDYLKEMIGSIPDGLGSVATVFGLEVYSMQIPWLSNDNHDGFSLWKSAFDLRAALMEANDLQQPLIISDVNQFHLLMNSPAINLAEKLDYWRVYYQLDKQLTFSIASICFNSVRTDAELFALISNPLLMRFITGSELVTIDANVNINMISSLINKAIWLRGRLDKSVEEVAMQGVIENILSRLTGEDLLIYYQTGNVQEKESLFASVFASKYSLLIDQLSEEDLLNLLNIPYETIINTDILTHPFVSEILNNDSILKRLSQKGFLAILNKISILQPSVITDHPACYPYISAELLHDWVESDYKFNFLKIKALLNIPEFLKKLNKNQLFAMARQIIGSDIEIILKNKFIINKLSSNQLLLIYLEGYRNFGNVTIIPGGFKNLNNSDFIKLLDETLDEYEISDEFMTEVLTECSNRLFKSRALFEFIYDKAKQYEKYHDHFNYLITIYSSQYLSREHSFERNANKLPNDIMATIVPHLDARSLVRLRQVSKNTSAQIIHELGIPVKAPYFSMKEELKRINEEREKLQPSFIARTFFKMQEYDGEMKLRFKPFIYGALAVISLALPMVFLLSPIIVTPILPAILLGCVVLLSPCILFFSIGSILLKIEESVDRKFNRNQDKLEKLIDSENKLNIQLKNEPKNTLVNINKKVESISTSLDVRRQSFHSVKGDGGPQALNEQLDAVQRARF